MELDFAKLAQMEFLLFRHGPKFTGWKRVETRKLYQWESGIVLALIRNCITIWMWVHYWVNDHQGFGEKLKM